MMNYLYTYCGVSIYYAENLETIGENLKEVHPHIFVSVPRLLEKVYDKIYNKGLELTGIKRALFFWALLFAFLGDDLLYSASLDCSCGEESRTNSIKLFTSSARRLSVGAKNAASPAIAMTCFKR
jgi:hypothetical protein